MATMEWQTKCGDFPLPPPRFVVLLRNAVPEKGIVCLDNGCVATKPCMLGFVWDIITA